MAALLVAEVVEALVEAMQDEAAVEVVVLLESGVVILLLARIATSIQVFGVHGLPNNRLLILLKVLVFVRRPLRTVPTFKRIKLLLRTRTMIPTSNGSMFLTDPA